MSAAGSVGGSVRPAMTAAALLLGQQVAARATRDALFLSAFDVQALPQMTAAAAVISLATIVVFSRALSRRSPARVLPAAVAASAVAFLAEWALSLLWPRPAAVAVYLHHAVLGAVLVSGFWSLVTERFDPHAAKLAMGPIGAGASLGGVIGGLLTWAAAAWLSPPNMLLALAVTSLFGLASVRQLARHAAAAAVPAAPALTPEASALRLIADRPYLRALAALVALTAFLDAVLDYLLAAAAEATFGAGAPLLSFFALFHAAAGLLALVAQTVLVAPLLQRAGPAWTLALPPLFTTAAAALAWVSPRLSAVVFLRGSHAVLRNSAFRSGYELLYTPIPDSLKRPTKIVVDVAFERAGTIAGSLAVALVLLVAPAAASRVLLVMAAAAAVGSVALAPLLRRGYLEALVTSLRAGAASLQPAGIVDPFTLLTLASVHGHAPTLTRHSVLGLGGPGAPADPMMEAIADLRSADPPRVTRVLASGALDPRLVAHVIPLLGRDGMFDLVAASLRRSAPRATGQLVDAMLDPEGDPATRRRIARILKAVPTQRAADGLLQGVADARFDLRYRCAQALLRIRALNQVVVIPAAFVLEAVAREAAHASDSPRHLEHCFNLLALVLERAPLETAHRALQSSETGLRGTALEYLDHVLPGTVRDKLWPHLGGPRVARSGRSADEIRDDLLRSRTSPRSGDSSGH